jgi:hypothetical protein
VVVVAVVVGTVVVVAVATGVGPCPRKAKNHTRMRTARRPITISSHR